MTGGAATALERLAPALARVGQAADRARDPWWIIGSAALVLHGVDPGPVADVDLLMSVDDAAALLTASNGEAAPGEASDRFRSSVFGRWTAAGTTVEAMGGFEAKGDGAANPDTWRPVWPRTRERVVVAGATLFVPSRPELAALLRRFGRAKDRPRAGRPDQPTPRSAGPNA